MGKEERGLHHGCRNQNCDSVPVVACLASFLFAVLLLMVPPLPSRF